MNVRLEIHNFSLRLRIYNVYGNELYTIRPTRIKAHLTMKSRKVPESVGAGVRISGRNRFRRKDIRKLPPSNISLTLCAHKRWQYWSRFTPLIRCRLYARDSGFVLFLTLRILRMLTVWFHTVYVLLRAVRINDARLAFTRVDSRLTHSLFSLALLIHALFYIIFAILSLFNVTYKLGHCILM